jgi:hypothetical protein
VDETCPEGQACDSTEGFDQGTCRELLPECMGVEPRHRFCNETTLQECGVDGVTSEVLESCTTVCEEGACNDNKDPCPRFPINCATDCGAQSSDCDLMPCPSTARISNSNPAVLRTPSYSELCPVACDAETHALVLIVSNATGLSLKLTIGEPWKLAVDAPGADDVACGNDEATGCVIVENAQLNSDIYVFTDDPSAAERNIAIEPGGTTCP